MTGDLTTVNVQDLAGHEWRRLKEENGTDNVADLANVAQRWELGPEVGIALRRVNRGLNDTWGDGVDPDAPRCVFDGQ